MKLLNKITNDPKQSFTITGEAGESIVFYLYFMPSQNAWFFSMESGSFEVCGMRLCASPNLLRCFKNNITFGLSCVTLDGYDPNSLNDFTSGRVRLDLLSAADVLSMEAVFYT